MRRGLLIFLRMRIKEIHYSSRYTKSLKRCGLQRKLIERKIDDFIRNPFSKSLKTHKLSGKLEGYWSFSVNYHFRVIFYFIDENIVGFVDIGTHEIYK